MAEKVLSSIVWKIFKYYFNSNEGLRRRLMDYYISRKGTETAITNMTVTKLFSFINNDRYFFKTLAKHINDYQETDNKHAYLEDLNSNHQQSLKPLLELYLTLASDFKHDIHAAVKMRQDDSSEKTKKAIQKVLINDTPFEIEKIPSSGVKSCKKTKDLTLVYRWNDMTLFIGRKEKISELHTYLKQEDCIIISGIKGIGKTSLVQAYLTKYSRDYDHIVWVSVLDNIKKSMIYTLAGAPDVHFSFTETEDSRGIDGSFDHLLLVLRDIPGQNLLIIDNANVPGDIREILNTFSKISNWHWKTIFTSFIETDIPGLIEITELEPAEAFKLFRAYYTEGMEGTEKRQTLLQITTQQKWISEMLGRVNHHTLLVELIAKVDKEDDLLSLQNMFEIIKDSSSIKARRLAIPIQPNVQDPQAMRLCQEDLTPYNYIRAIFTKDLERLNAREQKLLMYFSVLPSKPLKRSDVSSVFDLGEDELMVLLHNIRGWIKYDQEADAFRMVELYQFAVREILEPDAGKCDPLINCITKKIYHRNFRTIDGESWIDVKNIIEFAESVALNLPLDILEIKPDDAGIIKKIFIENIFSFSKVTSNNIKESFALMLLRLAQRKENQNMFLPAFQYAVNAALMYKVLQRDYCLSYIKTLATIASSLSSLDELNELALELRLHCQKLYQDCAEKDIFFNSQLLGEIGSSYIKLDDWQSAEAALVQAYKLLLPEKENNKFLIADVFDAIGLLYAQMTGSERAKMALAYFEQAHNTRKTINKKPHPQIASSLHHIGTTELTLGQYDDGLMHLSEAIKILKDLLYDTNHLELARMYLHYARALRLKAGTIKAEKESLALLEKALKANQTSMDIKCHYYPVEKYTFAKNHDEMAEIYYSIGQRVGDRIVFEKARGQVDQAILIRLCRQPEPEEELENSRKILSKIEKALNK